VIDDEFVKIDKPVYMSKELYKDLQRYEKEFEVKLTSIDFRTIHEAVHLLLNHMEAELKKVKDMSPYFSIKLFKKCEKNYLQIVYGKKDEELVP